MASSFPAQVAYNLDDSTVEEYTPDNDSDAFVPGDFVVLTNNEAGVCGANPSTIQGLAEVDSVEAAGITPNGKVPVRVLGPSTVLAMSSSTTPVEATHLGQKYGITKDGTTGFWQVDTSKTSTNARVYVERLNVEEGIWYVRVLGQYLGAAGIPA